MRQVARQHQAGRPAGDRHGIDHDLNVENGAVLRSVLEVGVERGTFLVLAQESLPLLWVGGSADVLDRHRQELLARVAIAADRGLVHGEETQRLDVVHPHGLRIRFEEEPVAGLAVAELRIGALALDRTGNLRGDELQNVLLPRSVPDHLGVALHHQHTDHPVLDPERNADPVDGRSPDHLDLVLLFKPAMDLRRGEQRLAGPEDVLGEPASERARFRTGIVLVHPIRKGEQSRRRVVQRDVEVLRRQQLPHDRVHHPQELGEVGRRVCGLRDAVGRSLRLFGASAHRLIHHGPDHSHGAALVVARDVPPIEDFHVAAVRMPEPILVRPRRVTTVNHPMSLPHHAVPIVRVKP